MERETRIHVGVVIFLVALMIPAVVSAQSGTAGGLAGVVKDATGAVLPGVAVEASSPALIEKVRSVVTDEQGQYKIVDLRPGVYSLTFTLSGFSSVRREGIQLTSGFTASVNPEMAVGNLDETITVTGESPVVDTQNVRIQRVMTDEVIDVLPSGRTASALAQLVPGLSATEGGVNWQDVGGLLGEGSRLVLHGSRPQDTDVMINGMWAQIPGGSHILMRTDVGTVEEVVYQLGGNSAEFMRGGVAINLIPKEGGNRHSASFFANGTTGALQSNNQSDELAARGLRAVNRLDQLWDVAGMAGGPIKHDRMWFFASSRGWRNDSLIAGVFHDSNLQDFTYTPDLSRQAHDFAWVANNTGRVTWQATSRNKLGGYLLYQRRANFGTPNAGQPDGRITAPEAALFQQTRTWYGQGTWTLPQTERLLLEAGVAYGTATVPRLKRRDLGIADDMWSYEDAGRNFLFGAPPAEFDTPVAALYSRAAVSYITGSHAFKAGMTLDDIGKGNASTTLSNNSMTLRLLNGVPNRLTMLNTPRRVLAYAWPMIALYAQDQWTINRLTLNGGLRFDYLHAYAPAQDEPATRFLGPRTTPEVRNLPKWKDLSPRMNAAYDLFGNGRTAVKAMLNKYLVHEATGIASRNHPQNTTVNSANRDWTDLNGDFVPQCDFLNPVPNGECGRLSDLAFGTQRVTTFFDPDLLVGSGVRPDNWETSVGVQHQLMPRMGLNAAYYRRWYGNFQVTDNRAVTPADFDPYCITAPADARLPVSGQRLCGFYDVKPAKFGLSDNLVTFANNFGTQQEVYDGVDVSVSARPRTGIILEGGFSTGRTKLNSCFAVDSPQALRPGFCDVTPPFLTSVKFLGTYRLPWDVDVSGTMQSNPGPPVLATYVATNAEIAPTLGRNLASGPNGTATVALLPEGALYEDRSLQIDFRASKVFHVGRARLRGMFDLYNILNDNTVLAQNNQYGPAWRQPTFILPGRMVKFGFEAEF